MGQKWKEWMVHKEHEVSFGRDGNALYPNCSRVYTSVYNYQNSTNWMPEVDEVYSVWIKAHYSCYQRMKKEKEWKARRILFTHAYYSHSIGKHLVTCPHLHERLESIASRWMAYSFATYPPHTRIQLFTHLSLGIEGKLQQGEYVNNDGGSREFMKWTEHTEEAWGLVSQ